MKWRGCPPGHALPHSIRTGEIAYEHVKGRDIWHYYRENPETGEHFARWMTQGTRVSNQAIFEAFDFSSFKTVIDVGGGQGLFLLTGQSLPRFSNKPNEANRLSAREMIGPINRELTIQSTLFSIASLSLSVKVTIGRLTNYKTLLERHPSCLGVLFDQPDVVALAPEWPRMRRVGGSFFESVPPGGDLYIL